MSFSTCTAMIDIKFYLEHLLISQSNELLRFAIVWIFAYIKIVFTEYFADKSEAS